MWVGSARSSAWTISISYQPVRPMGCPPPVSLQPRPHPPPPQLPLGVDFLMPGQHETKPITPSWRENLAGPIVFRLLAVFDQAGKQGQHASCVEHGLTVIYFLLFGKNAITDGMFAREILCAMFGTDVTAW